MSKIKNQYTDQVSNQLTELLGNLGYQNKGMCSLENQPLVAQALGNLFYNYLIGNVYDVDWEGYSTTELHGVLSFMSDMATYQKNQ